MGKIIRWIGPILLAVFLLSCTKDNNFSGYMGGKSDTGKTEGGTRATSPPRGRVMLLYSAGFHNLSASQKNNIAELEEGYLPLKIRNENVLLVFARNTVKDYSTPVSPVLIRLYRTSEGTPVRDTVKTWPAETLASDPQTFNEVLSYVRDSYPAESYGVVFSSHGTGWLPENYYSNASEYVFDAWSARRTPLRTAGMDVTDKAGEKRVITEMEIEQMAAAIPMHLDYFIFDACLMACVEVAYAFRDKVSLMGFSPAEVLSTGFDYKKMGSLLLEGPEADPVRVCSSYLERYMAQSGSYKSASISMVDLSKMDELAEICNWLFGKYRSEIAAIHPTTTTVDSDGEKSVTCYRPQNYFTGDHRWFYDLRDILVTAGVSEEDLAALDAVLKKVVVYEGHTPNFLVTTRFQFHSCSGLSMFLPSDNRDKDLEAFYRTLSWNEATYLLIPPIR